MELFLKIIIIAFLSICLITIMQSCRKIYEPTVTTEDVTAITTTNAISGGNVTNNGGAEVIARGVCWGIAADPKIDSNPNKTSDGKGNGHFTSSITGLTSNTEYHVCAYATNSEGTNYGKDVRFTTDPNILHDIDGNAYPLVKIGSQLWMAENLKTTKFNDATSITKITSGTVWRELSSAAYCWYSNDEAANKYVYGGLYNWFAVNSGKLCPTGWHVPSDAEWTVLTDYLGGLETSCAKLKEIGATHWNTYGGGTNETGFTALPGGLRYGDDGSFWALGRESNWWSSSENSPVEAWYRRMWEKMEKRSVFKKSGYSIRCIKDQ